MRLVLRAGAALLVTLTTLAAVVSGCGASSSSAASPPGDAGPDAFGTRDPDATGLAPTWCDQKPHAFCADFDGLDLLGRWAQVQPDTDSFEVAPSDRSPPNALHLSGTAEPNKYDTFGGGNLLAKLTAPSAQTVRVALDLQVDASTALDDQYGLAVLNFSAQDPKSPNVHVNIAGLRVYASRSTLYVDDLGGDADLSPARQVDMAPFPIGRWVHVELSLVTKPTEIDVTMALDGAAAAQGALASGSFTTGDFELQVSAFRAGPGVATIGPVSLLFDDVTVDVE